jgi:hypothetical protein
MNTDLPILEKESKIKEQTVDYNDYGLIDRIGFPTNIPTEKLGLI